MLIFVSSFHSRICINSITHLFIHSSNKYLLSTCFASGTAVNTEDAAEEKENKIPSAHVPNILVGWGRLNKQKTNKLNEQKMNKISSNINTTLKEIK